MRTVIIGAVALGASAAARIKRLNPQHEVVLLEKGSYASFANCGLPYFVGDEIKQQSSLLVVGPEVFKKRFQIDLRVRNEVLSIDPIHSRVRVLNKDKNETYELDYDNLILAMGADAIKPNIPGVDNKHVHFLKTIDDAVKLKTMMKDSHRVAVIGGGFIGLEAMENLVNINKEVTLIEGKPSVSNLDYDMAKILHNIIKDHGVNLRTNEMLQSIKENSDNSLTITTSNGEIIVDDVIMSIGVKPNIKIAREAGIELDENNTIKVDDNLRTNFQNIYAGGDLVSNYEAITNHLVYIPLANYANKHGRIIANNICGINSTRQKITMASVFKLFNYTVASVGIGEAMATRFNIDSEVIYQSPFSHASYYPGAKRIYSKMRYDKSGKIYGLQMVGEELVEKRVDTLSALLLKGATYHDLMEAESCYAPPFNSAKDPLNFFGFMIDNVINGGIKTISPLEIDKIKDHSFILDVRGHSLYNDCHIPGAINIPLDELRDHLNLLPKDKTIYVCCIIGLSSYNAICILRDLGYDCVNISGGNLLYQLMTK